MSALAFQASAYPRIGHIRAHLRAGYTRSRERNLAVLDWLLEPLTLDEVAERLGPGYTRRMVELSFEYILRTMPLDAPATAPLRRLAILRIAAGLDPCWCESEAA